VSSTLCARVSKDDVQGRGTEITRVGKSSAIGAGPKNVQDDFAGPAQSKVLRDVDVVTLTVHRRARFPSAPRAVPAVWPCSIVRRS
jgi:hypothetical protein